MGWGMIAAPGQEFGPCKDDCTHTDCKENRKDSEAICRYCGKPIGYETKFYCEKQAPAREPAHAICVWGDAERKK